MKKRFAVLFLTMTVSLLSFAQQDSADFYNKSGLEYFNNGDYARAVEDFSQALRLEPDNADFYNNRGNAYFSKGEEDLAFEDYSKGILVDPNNARSYLNRGNIYSKRGDYNKAVEDYTHTLLLNPNFALAYNNRGFAYFSGGDHKRAIEDYTQAILLGQNLIMAYNNRANAYNSIGEYNRAIEDYTQTIQLNPNYAPAYFFRGTAYYAIEEYAKAIEDYTNTIRLTPDFASAFFNRGNAYSDNGDYDRAVEDYTRAILLGQNNADVYTGRGTAYGSKGEYELAVKDYTRAILLDPEAVLAYVLRGIMYSANDEYDPAIEDLTQAIRLNPNLIMPYGYRGNCYAAKGEYDKAIEDYTRALRLDPNDPDFFNSRGIAFNSKGEYDRAIEDFTHAILLGSNNTEYFNNRGVAYSGKGENDRAVEDFTQAILLEPDNAWAYVNRATSYLHKGEYDSAIADFTQAILFDSNDPDFFNNRSIAYLNKGEYDSAIEDCTRAILLKPDYPMSYTNRGVAHHKKGDYDRAIEDFSSAILLDPNFAWPYNNRGLAYSGKGEYDLAVVDFEKALEAAETSANLNMIFSFTMNYTDDIYKDYPYLKIEKALPFTKSYVALAMNGIARSVRRAEQIRSNLGARGSAIMTQALYFYYMGLDLESQFGSAEKAFEYSESLRSRGFLDQLGTEAALQLPGISGEERERIRHLLNEIENRQNVLAAFRERAPQTPEEERSFVDAGQTISVLEAELAALDAKIGSRIPQYAELRSPVPASLARAQDWLDKKTAVLIYALWDDTIDFIPLRDGNTVYEFSRPTVNSYCLVLTKDGLTAVRLEPGFDYAKSINELRRKITSLNSFDGTPIFTEAEFETERNALYSALFKPVRKYIPPNITEIMIVPDSTLGHLPFDLLRENSKSPDLGQSYRISLSPSVSVSILAAETRVAQNLPIMAFGGAWYSSDKTAADRSQRGIKPADNESSESSNGSPSWRDIPGTEAEVKNLQTMVASPNGIRVFLGSQVSEARIKALSSQGDLAKYPILHFACHGYFNEKDPGRSGIVLSEVSGLLDNKEDGYLTIPEIVLLNLRARMILLSACETGLGVVRRGDGMVGMARAFLVSGAENVGVSLWSISDEATMAIMTALYSKVLKEGQSFKEGYYQVRNDFRRDKRWSHPFYWAAFTMYE